MITYLQALILGGIQGIAELFPISSLGHSILIPELFRWNIVQNSDYFLIFLVVTHLATALVLFGFFRKDWMNIIRGMLRSLKERAIDLHDTDAKLGWLLVVSTIPVGILGLLFEDKIKSLLASPRLVAVILVANGVLLYGAELLMRKASSVSTDLHNDSQIAKLSWTQSVKIGFAQCFALIPGFSRTGASLGGGLLVGLNHKNAARFSFLLATSIIFAAAVLKLPELLGNGSFPLGPIIVGFFASGIMAYISIRFLTNYFKTKTLTPFAIYCVLFGGVLLAIFLMR